MRIWNGREWEGQAEDILARNKNFLNKPLTKEDTKILNKYKQSDFSNIKYKKDDNIGSRLSKVGGTLLNTGVEIGKGIVKGVENTVVDPLIQLGSSEYNPFMHLLYDGKVKDGQKIAQELIQEDMTKNFTDNVLGYNKKLSNGKTIQQALDDNSYVRSDNVGGQVAQAVGNMLPSIMVGNAGAGQLGATLLMGANAYGSGIEEAYNEGANRGKANLYGLGNALIETGTEYITGGIPGVQKLGKIASNTKLGKIANIVNKLNLDNIAAKGLDKVSNKVAKELLNVGYKMIGEGTEEALSEILKPYLKNATYSEGKKVDWNEVLNSAVVGAITGGILEAPINVSNVRNAVTETKASSNILSSNNQIEVLPTYNQQNSIRERLGLEQNNETPINNLINSNNKYIFEQSDNEKLNNLRRSAVEQGFNNSEQTRNFMNMLEKIVTDKNIDIVFDNKLAPNINGKYENGTITINPNSTRAGEFIATHELTHAIGTDTMKNIIEKYRKSNVEFDKAVTELLSRNYATNELNEEAMADVAGQLFGNQEFINNLSMENPSLFKRIYNEIKYLWHQFRGYKNQSQFIEDLQYKWEQAYRNNTKLNNDSMFLKGKLTNGDDVVISDDVNGSHPTRFQVQKSLENMLGMKYNNQSNNQVLEITDKDIKKYLNDGYHNNKNMNLKKRISGNYGEILEISKIDPSKSKSNYKGTNRGKQGFDYYYVNLAYPLKDVNGNIIDHRYYDARLVVRKEDNGSFAYDLDKFKEKKGVVLDENSSIMANKSADDSFDIDNVPQNNKNVNSDTSSTKYSIQESKNNAQELDNSSFSLKQKQLEIINNTNPADDDVHTWVRNVDDIKTFEEAFFEDGEYSGMDPDFTENMANQSLKSGKIIVYSSYPIENGVFVSPSKMEAQQYAGGDTSKLYSKEVNLNDVAWIDGAEGQYAKVEGNIDFDNKGRKLSEQQREYFKDSKVRDENGNLLTMYHGTPNGNFTEFNPGSYFSSNENYANNYQDENASILKQNKGVTNKKTYQVYLNITNPFELSNSVARDIYINEFIKGGNSEYFDPYTSYNDYVKQFSQNDGFEWLEAEELKEWILENHPEFDGLVVQEVPDNVNPDAINLAYIPFNSNQIKNIDNINPTSNNDIRYSKDNNTWQEYLESNFRSSGTKTDMKVLKGDMVLQEPQKVENKPPVLPKNPTKESSYDDFKETKKTRKEVQKELQDEMGITIDDISIGKDISSIAYQRTDPIRLNERVFGAEIGKKINDATINKTKHNEAERIRFLNKERDEIKNLGIKPRSKESAAVQKYGEKQYVSDKGQVHYYSDANLAAEFPNIETQEKIKKAAQVIRNKYDKYIDTINQTITELGYDPIPKRKDYMRHFQELNDKFTQWGLPLNRQSLNENNIPTDINGLTDQFKPGKNWFASAMQRKGLKTTYDAITGIDGYLEGASNLMYHTEDIQRYRALSKLVRDTFGQTHGLDNVDLSTEEGQKRLNDIYDNKLSKYAAWLDEQANALAGKKGAIDRGAERVLGRRIYSVLDAAKKQVGSNMTGFNVRSALTNFASAVQGASKTNKLAFIKGTLSTVKNIIHNDGLINKSDFLTSRLMNDSQLSKKMWQKASNAGQIFMSGTDYFTSNQIWRSKYYENLSKGMSEAQAIKNADDFAARIMGDRSKGATAEIFNSKTLGLLTQFQLEVNNQWSSMIHDNKVDVKNGNRTAASVVFQLGQLAAMSYLFNNFMKSMTGSDVMIDPIDMLKKLFGADDDDKSLEERAQEVLGDVVNNLPFASFLTGGRIPVAEAFTGASTAFKKLTGQKDKYGNDIKWSNVKDDAILSAFYWLLPTGYGQAKKTTQGLSMYNGSLPTAGSYTKSGNLRFTADESVGGKIKATLFGQYSSKEAQEYIESGYKTISKNNIQEMKDLGMNSTEYRNYRQDLSDAGTKKADKINYINNLDISIEKKNIMANNISKDTKNKIDMEKYNDYDSYEEYSYSQNNPTKYNTFTKLGVKYSDYKKYEEKIKEIKEKYSGNSNSKIRQTKVKNYIQSLPYKAETKLMLHKLIGGYSIKGFEKQMFNYIEGLKLSAKEKREIHNYLFK